MSKRPELVALVLLVMLSFFVAAQNIFLLPTFAAMLAGLGVSVSAPTRLAFSLSQYGTMFFLVFVAVIVLAIRRIQPKGDRARQAQVLNVASIVVAIAILLQASVYVDFAKVAGQVMNGRSTASTTK